MNSRPIDTGVSEDTGSTAIEIIIAFAIVSIALIQGYDLISASARSAAAMSEKVSALVLAENRLSLLRTARSADVIETEHQTTGKFTHSIRLTPVKSGWQSHDADVSRAYRVTVSVTSAGREVVRLESWALFPFDRQ